MAISKRSFRFKTRVWAMVSCAALASGVLGLSACGVLSSADRDETPSALMLRAQKAYDAGDYNDAINLLEKVIAQDPNNQQARVRLALTYNLSAGISPLNVFKSLAGGSGSSSGTSGSSDITKLTSGAGLSKARTDALSSARLALLSGGVTKLRADFPEFEKFHKAFLTICPFFSESTITKLKTEATNALEILGVSQCRNGVANTADANITIAALTLAIDQFATLYKAILDSNNDGKIDIEKESQDASSNLKNVSNLATPTEKLNAINSATRSLTEVSVALKSDIYKLAFAQFNIISGVVDGSNLPANIKDPMLKAVAGLQAAVAKINEYLDSGKTTSASASGGTAAQTAAANANTQANNALATVTDQEQINNSCKNIYCFRVSYGLSTSSTGDLPTKCGNAPYQYTCTQ